MSRVSNRDGRALLLRGFERLGNVPRNRHGLIDRDRAARDDLGEPSA
jgi:hypothetical protein